MGLGLFFRQQLSLLRSAYCRRSTAIEPLHVSFEVGLCAFVIQQSGGAGHKAGWSGAMSAMLLRGRRLADIPNLLRSVYVANESRGSSNLGNQAVCLPGFTASANAVPWHTALRRSAAAADGAATETPAADAAPPSSSGREPETPLARHLKTRMKARQAPALSIHCWQHSSYSIWRKSPAQTIHPPFAWLPCECSKDCCKPPLCEIGALTRQLPRATSICGPSYYFCNS